MSTKRSHILKEISRWKLQVSLSMCDLLLDTRHKRVAINKMKQNFNQFIFTLLQRFSKGNKFTSKSFPSKMLLTLVKDFHKFFFFFFLKCLNGSSTFILKFFSMIGNSFHFWGIWAHVWPNSWKSSVRLTFFS